MKRARGEGGRLGGGEASNAIIISEAANIRIFMRGGQRSRHACTYKEIYGAKQLGSFPQSCYA